MPKLLVTGGLGFIGSNFIRQVLATTDWSVVNLDSQTYSGNPANLNDVEKNARYRYVKGDITDGAVVALLMPEADTVVHFAAETHVDRSILDPSAFLKTNIMGTWTLLEVARREKIKLFLHVSTDEVYGSLVEGEAHEDSPLLPNSPYAASKASSDLLVRSYQVTYGLPAIISRCSNNFGPYQYPEKALPLLMTNALEDKPYPLYGDGGHVRDWLYVLDHVRALLLLIGKGKPGGIYNIGGTHSTTNKELVSKVLDLMEKPAMLIRPVPDRPGHDQRYALNCDKIRKLGWNPVTPFETALRETIRWYRENGGWWKPLKGAESYRAYYSRQYASPPST